MVSFEAVSSWVQIAQILVMIGCAGYAATLFHGISRWVALWVAVGVGFSGMLESRVFLVLYAYGIETPTLRWLGRYVTPLQASTGLSVGMVLLVWLLYRLRAVHGLIQLPHPAGFVVDEHGIVVAWDAGAVELFGWTAAEAVGANVTELIIPTARRAVHRPFIERHLALTPTGQTGTWIMTARWRDTAREFHVEVLVSPQAGDVGLWHFRCVARELVPIGA